MDLLNEARVQLESVVGADLLKEYFGILRQWFLLNSPVNKEEFDRQARKLLLNEEQVVAHNRFLRALLEKTSSDTSKITQTIEPPEPPPKHKSGKDENGKSLAKRARFEPADISEYVRPLSPSKTAPSDFTVRYAASELFMPDQGLISARIALNAWENGLQGAESDVSELIVGACQMFVKNILTAMISKKKGYKIRDGKFQYGYNLPIPDPFLRNYANVIDDTAESKVEVLEDDDSFVPRAKPSLERVEQQVAFAYASSRQRRVDNTLSVQLLYDTLKQNPKLLGLSSNIQVHLLKLNLKLES